jgi:hypothetical protein
MLLLRCTPWGLARCSPLSPAAASRCGSSEVGQGNLEGRADQGTVVLRVEAQHPGCTREQTVERAPGISRLARVLTAPWAFHSDRVDDFDERMDVALDGSIGEHNTRSPADRR